MPFNNYGFSPNSAAEELLAVQQVFVNTFGSQVNLNPSTINGVLIQQLTNMGVSVEADKALLYSQLYNPYVATGVWLDGLCKWNNILRTPAISSVVTCQVTGLSGTVIPINSQILNTNGDIFYNQIAITIGSGGTATGTFYSLVTGPIPCSAATLTRIVQQLPGWDTVNNSSDGVVGKIAQTDTELRYARNYELSVNSTSTFDAIVAACYQEPTISNFYLAQNDLSVPQTIGGVTVPANGIYLSVYGGSDQTVTTILLNKKSAGCVMGGNTTFTIVNPTYSWSTFTATYQRPTPTALEVDITIANLSTYPADIVTQIQNAVVANFYGEDGINQFVQIGVTMFAQRFVGTLNLLGVNEIYSVLTCVLHGSPATSVLLPINQVPTLLAANVNVVLI